MKQIKQIVFGRPLPSERLEHERLNKKTALALDYQEQTPHSAPGVATTKTYFLHLVANY